MHTSSDRSCPILDFVKSHATTAQANTLPCSFRQPPKAPAPPPQHARTCRNHTHLQNRRRGRIPRLHSAYLDTVSLIPQQARSRSANPWRNKCGRGRGEHGSDERSEGGREGPNCRCPHCLPLPPVLRLSRSKLPVSPCFPLPSRPFPSLPLSSSPSPSYPLPPHVPRSDKQTLPFSYRFGFRRSPYETNKICGTTWHRHAVRDPVSFTPASFPSPPLPLSSRSPLSWVQKDREVHGAQLPADTQAADKYQKRIRRLHTVSWRDLNVGTWAGLGETHIGRRREGR